MPSLSNYTSCKIRAIMSLISFNVLFLEWKKNVIILLIRALLMTLCIRPVGYLTDTPFLSSKRYFLDSGITNASELLVTFWLLFFIVHFPGRLSNRHIFSHFGDEKKNLASVINHKTAFFVNCLNFAYPATIFHFSLLNFHLLLWVYFIDTYLIVF